MGWFKRSILSQVLGIILLVNLVVALVAGTYFVFSIQLNQQYVTLTDRDMGAAMAIQDVHEDFKTQVQEWKNVLLRGHTEQGRDRHWRAFQALESKIQNDLSTLLAQLPAGESRDLVRQFQASHQQMGGAYRQGLQAYVSAGSDPVAGDEGVRGIDREPSRLIAQAAEMVRNEALAEAHGLAERGRSQTLLVGSLLMLAIILGTLACAWVIHTAVIRPATQMIAVIQRLGEGDATQELTVRRSDELGRLADAARQLRAFLIATREQLIQNADGLEASCETIRINAQQVSQRAEEAHLRIDQIATAMNEMSATAQEVAQQAAIVASQVQETSMESDAAGGQIETAVSSMQRLVQQINASAATVSRLAEDGRKVSHVMTVIREIADQTNLLALNAAIEAARAGEAGRGFAVVADEVRTLAAKTQDATVEIDRIIETIGSGSNEATNFMAESEQIGDQSRDAVAVVRETLVTMNGRMGRVNDATAQVATAAEEQTSVCEDINRHVSEVAEISEAMSQAAERNMKTVPELEAMSIAARALSARITA